MLSQSVPSERRTRLTSVKTSVRREIYCFGVASLPICSSMP